MGGLRLIVVVACALGAPAWAEKPVVELGVPEVVGEAVQVEASRRLLLTDQRPAAEALPVGTIALSPNVHLVPIRLDPIRAGLHETVAIEVDIERGLRPLRLELAGTG